MFEKGFSVFAHVKTRGTGSQQKIQAFPRSADVFGYLIIGLIVSYNYGEIPNW